MSDQNVDQQFKTSASQAFSALPEGFILDGRYEIICRLGHGGMSTVYKAKHTELDRPVAIKILDAKLAGDPVAVQRFRNEAVTVSTLKHPNIVEVFGFGNLSQQPYIAMEFLKGISLADLLKQEQRLVQAHAMLIFDQICDALEHAHNNHLIHRDLKPSNVILVGPHHYVKLVDFGIAKFMPESGKEMQRLTQTAQLFGTLAYMSPEQLMGQPVNARSDIYSMGCLMYEVMTGSPPFKADSPFAVAQKHSNEKPPESEYLKNAFGAVILKALEKNPARRPQSASQLKASLTHPPEARKQINWHGPAKVGAASVLAGAFIFAALSLVSNLQKRNEIEPKVVMPEEANPKMFVERAQKAFESKDYTNATKIFHLVVDADQVSPVMKVMSYYRLINADPKNAQLYRQRLVSEYAKMEKDPTMGSRDDRNTCRLWTYLTEISISATNHNYAGASERLELLLPVLKAQSLHPNDKLYIAQSAAQIAREASNAGDAHSAVKAQRVACAVLDSLKHEIAHWTVTKATMTYMLSNFLMDAGKFHEGIDQCNQADELLRLDIRQGTTNAYNTFMTSHLNIATAAMQRSSPGDALFVCDKALKFDRELPFKGDRDLVKQLHAVRDKSSKQLSNAQTPHQSSPKDLAQRDKAH